MSTTSRATHFNRLSTTLFCLLTLINYAKATIDYRSFRNDTISEETKRDSVITTRTILEEVIKRNITSADHLQHGTELLLLYGALLRTQILETFGKLVYEHYDDFRMSQIEALYRVYRETLDRKYNIFDIVPSVLNEPDTRPTKICAYINDHVKTCLKESSKVCMNVNIHDEPYERTFSQLAVNVTKKMYELAEMPVYYPRGFSLAAVFKYLTSGRLRFTPALFSGLLLNAQYDTFDDKVRTAERELVFFLTRSSKFSKQIEQVSTSSGSVSVLLRNYLTNGEQIFTGKALRHASFLAEHVIREVDAISENIEWLGTTYDNSTIHLKYLFELILPNDTMDRDIVDARNYLLHQIKDKKIVEKYLRIEKYQQAGPDQLLMEIFGQLRDIHFAEDLVTSLYTHARFWHKSHMIETLDELLELFDAYENLRGLPKYRELLQNADRIKSNLVHSKNVTVELLCSTPRTCLRIGLEMVKNCAAIDEKTKAAIDIFTNPRCRCSCLEAESAVWWSTSDMELNEAIDESTKQIATPIRTEIPGDIFKMIDITTMESHTNSTPGVTLSSAEQDSSTEDDDKLGTGGNDGKKATSIAPPTRNMSPEFIPDDGKKNTSEPLIVIPCVEDCSSTECRGPDCQSPGKSTDIQCEGSDCYTNRCEGPACLQTHCKEGNCTISSNSSESSSCGEDDCEEHSTSQSDCTGPDCLTIGCEEDSCQDQSLPENGQPRACDGPQCTDSHSTESTCKSPNCEDNNTPPSVCSAPDCQLDTKANGTVSTEKTSCLGPDCSTEDCVENYCKDNATHCEAPNCSNVSCEDGDCPNDPDSSSLCEAPDCENNFQLDERDSTATCKSPNCSYVDFLEHCESSDCTIESKRKCEESDCSKEPKNGECQAPDCKNDGIPSIPEESGCQGGNCTRKDDCTGSNCPIESTADCEAPNCTDTKGTGHNCTGESRSDCEGLDCSNNNCTGPNRLENVTMSECSSFNCLNNATDDCNGLDCPKMNCTNSDCLGDVSNTNCTYDTECPSGILEATVCPTPDCPLVAFKEKSNCKDGNCSSYICEGDSCNKISTEKIPPIGSTEDQNGDDCGGQNCKNHTKKLCQGPNCSAELTMENKMTKEPCINDNCTTVSPTVEDNCGGDNCTGNATTEESKEIEKEEICEGKNCEGNGTTSCESDECTNILFKEQDEQVTKEPCPGDNCTTVSLILDVDCEGVNCTSNSTEVKLKTIKIGEDCKSGDCERNFAIVCEGNECSDELGENENKEITEGPCNDDNCTSITFSPKKEIERTQVPTESSADVAYTDTRAVKRLTTFCGNRDPHYRRQRNRLRKMQHTATSTSKYRDWNNIISPPVIEKISTKVNNYSNINVNEDSNLDINKNSNINVNEDSHIDTNNNLNINVNTVEKKFDQKIRKKNPLYQVLGNTKSKINNGRKNAQLREKKDNAVSGYEINEKSTISLSTNQTDVAIKNLKKINSGHRVIDGNEEETNSRKIKRQKKIQLKNQHEEGVLEKNIKKNNEEGMNFRSTEEAAVKRARIIVEKKNNNDKIDKEINEKTNKVMNSAVKNYTKSIGNDKSSERRRKKVLIMRWLKLGAKVSQTHVKSAAKSTGDNGDKEEEDDEEEVERELRNSEMTGKTYEKSVGNDNLSMKRETDNFRIEVENQNSKATKSSHEQDDNESVSEDESSDEVEIEGEAQKNSSGSQKGWRGSSTKSNVQTTNEGNVKDNRKKNKMESEWKKLYFVLKEKHGWNGIRRNGSAKHEEKETKREMQDDMKNRHNGWKILENNAQKSSVQRATEERRKWEKNVNPKTKLEFEEGWNKIRRKNLTKMKELSNGNWSRSHEDPRLDEIVFKRGTVRSKSKGNRNSRKRPTDWPEKRRMKKKYGHSSRGGHTWDKKTLRTEELGTHRTEPPPLRALKKSELLKGLIKIENEKEKINASEQLPSAYRADTPRKSKSSVLKRILTLKRKKNMPDPIMQTHQLREVNNTEFKKSAPVTSSE